PGVFGHHVSVDGTAPGVLGQTSSTAAGSAAVKGLGGPCSTCLGMIGTAPGNGVGVLGQSLGDGTGWGLDGVGGPSGIGAFGHTPMAPFPSYGVVGSSGSTSTNAAGVYGTISSNADYSGGVRGENFNTNCCGFGVVGFHAGQGI